MNKLGQSRDNSGLILIIIAIFVGIILILYFLSQLFFAIGIILIIISLILIFIALSNNDGEILIIGAILLGLGILLLIVGLTGLHFFEQNATGKNLLNSANTIVNATREGVNVYSNLP